MEQKAYHQKKYEQLQAYYEEAEARLRPDSVAHDSGTDSSDEDDDETEPETNDETDEDRASNSPESHDDEEKMDEMYDVVVQTPRGGVSEEEVDELLEEQVAPVPPIESPRRMLDRDEAEMEELQRAFGTPQEGL